MAAAAAIVAAHHPVQERSISDHLHDHHHLPTLYTSEQLPHLHDHHVHHHEDKHKKVAMRNRLEERRPSEMSLNSIHGVTFGRGEDHQNGNADTDSLPEGCEPSSPLYKSASKQTSNRQTLSSISSQDWEVIMASSGLMSPDHTPQKLWIDEDRFQFCIGTLITLNVIIIGLETDLRDRTVEFQAMTPWKMVECVFCLIWISEALLRMYFEHWLYFVSGWNILDVVLVVSSIIELFILPYIVGKEFLPAFFRAVRILRLLRLLRLVRLVPFFKELWLIICGYVEALKTLGWVLLLLAIIIYSGAIYMTILVGQQCAEKWDDWNDCVDIWGSVPGSMYSLFQVLTLESWSMLIARPVLKKKPHLAAFFLAFLMLTTFGLLNIIVGVIVENTLKASNNEMRRSMLERDAKMRVELLGLKELFEEADEDKNGNVDVEEFKSMIQKPEVQQRLRNLDIPCENPESLFEILDEDGGGSITIFEFIEGASRLKSAPKPTELRAAAHQVHNTSQTINKMKVTIGQMAKALGMNDVAASAAKKRTVSRPSSPNNASRRKKHLSRVGTCDSAESLASYCEDGAASTTLEKESPNSELRRLGEDSFKRRGHVPHPKVHDPTSPFLSEANVFLSEANTSVSGASAPNGNPPILNSSSTECAPVWDHPKMLASHSANRERLEGIEWSVGQRLQRLERIAHNLVRSQNKVRDAVNEVLARVPQSVPSGASVPVTGA